MRSCAPPLASLPRRTPSPPRRRATKKAVLYSNLNAIGGVIGTASWTTRAASVFARRDAVGPSSTTTSTKPTWPKACSTRRRAATRCPRHTRCRQRSRARQAVHGRALSLTDTAGAGPWTFAPSSVSFSVGRGGLLFNRDRPVESGDKSRSRGRHRLRLREERGHRAPLTRNSLGTLNFFARARARRRDRVERRLLALPFDGAIAGTDDKAGRDSQSATGRSGDARHRLAGARLRESLRCRRTHVDYARQGAQPRHSRAGKVDVVAGPAAQSRRASCRARRSRSLRSRSGRQDPGDGSRRRKLGHQPTISIAATVYVQKEYNTAAFYAQVSADYAAFAKATEIGGGPLGVVSAELGGDPVVPRRPLAGRDLRRQDFTPRDDVAPAWNEVPIFAKLHLDRCKMRERVRGNSSSGRCACTRAADRRRRLLLRRGQREVDVLLAFADVFGAPIIACDVAELARVRSGLMDTRRWWSTNHLEPPGVLNATTRRIDRPRLRPHPASALAARARTAARLWGLGRDASP